MGGAQSLLRDATPGAEVHCPHCRTRRWEAHLWVEGKQLYLGGYLTETEAALAYDLAALKLRGTCAQLNFELANYSRELVAYEQVQRSSACRQHLLVSLHASMLRCFHVLQYTDEEVIANIRASSRRKKPSKYKGVTKHKAKWEARLGTHLGGCCAFRCMTHHGLLAASG